MKGILSLQECAYIVLTMICDPLQIDLGKERILPLASLRGRVRPVILAGTESYIRKVLPGPCACLAGYQLSCFGQSSERSWPISAYWRDYLALPFQHADISPVPSDSFHIMQCLHRYLLVVYFIRQAFAVSPVLQS